METSSKGYAGKGKRGGKLRGRPNDSEDVRMSKTLSWILRHGSQAEGLAMRPDGYVRVDDLLKRPKMKSMTLTMLNDIVAKDEKKRYNLLSETDITKEPPTETWWIRANQGHSLKSVELDLQPIQSAADVPTGIAVHGTSRRAWDSIREQGLNKMKRNHIHLAQGAPGGDGVISGMRKSSAILIYINVQKALDAGLDFYLSDNGVVLTPGDAEGYLRPEFFARVETSDGKPIQGWEGIHDAHNIVRKETTADGEVVSSSRGTEVQEPSAS